MQHSNLPLRTLSSVVVLCLFSFTYAAETESGGTPSIDTIISRALTRAEWYQENSIETGFEFQTSRISRKLGDDSAVVEHEEYVYEAVPVGKHLFERLILRDGRELDSSELRDEEKREAKFRKTVAEGKAPFDESRERVVFNRELVDKYIFKLKGLETHDGYSVWVLQFEPKGGDLPEKTRLDKALNKSFGEIWVETRTYEIARVHFELKEKIGIWWGLIGSISALNGTIERREVAPGFWMPESVDIYLKGRIFLSSLHRSETIKWSQFKRRADFESPPQMTTY